MFAPDFLLPCVDGRNYSLSNFADKPILVVVFMCNHCPYVQASLARLIALQKEFGDRCVQFVGINANDAANYPEDDFDHMKLFAVERGMDFPYLRDESQGVAKVYGAVCTPDIFVYDKERKLVYHGRIDDNWKEPEKATKHELKAALEAFLEGRKPDGKQNPSMGCSIKWKE